MKIIDLLVKRVLLLVVVLILAVSARSQHLNFIDNIEISADGTTNDIVIDLIEAGDKLFVYSTKSILVYDLPGCTLNTQIDLPGNFGKFNPVFVNYRAYVSDIQLMTHNTDDNLLYVVTPDIRIIAIDVGNPAAGSSFIVDPTPDSINHFQVLNGFSILKYDEQHNRLYWVVEGRSTERNQTGNFHTRDTYLSLYTVEQGGGVTCVHEEFVEGVDENYNNTLSDVEFSNNSHYYFVARKKHIDVYNFNSPGVIYRTFKTVPGKFGKLMYEPFINKIIALPYRLPFDCGGTCEPLWSEDVCFYYFDADNPSDKDSVLSPSKRITDGYFLESRNDLILCYANDAHVQSAVTGPSDVAIYNYDDINDTFQFEYSLETNGIPSGLYTTHFELNRPLKVCRDVSTGNGAIISKVHEVTSLISNQGNPYTDSQVIRGDGNVFYKGIGADSNNYLLNLAFSGVEILNNQTVSNSIQTGSTVYNITANPIGRKLYFFNKFHSYNSNLFIYDIDNATISNLNEINPTNKIDQTIGDCVYNPYENHLIISEGGAMANGKIKIYDASTMAFIQEISLSDDYLKEMYVAPDEKLYVLANMYNEPDQNPRLYIIEYTSGTYDPGTPLEINMPEYINEFLYYVGNFCYVPQKQRLYITISPNDTTQIIPYQSIQNTKLHIEPPFSQTNSVILEIRNDEIVGISEAVYARKMICPDAINPDQTSQYNDKLFILGNTLLVLDYTQPLSTTFPTDNPSITSIQLEDATYSPFHDKVFGFQDIYLPGGLTSGERKADIQYIDGMGTSTSLDIGDHGDGQAAGIFYNPHDHYLYLHKWLDNPKLGDEQCKLLCFDPSLYPGNIFLESVDMDNTSFFPDYYYNDDAHWEYYHITDHYIDPVSNKIYIPNGGHSNVSVVGFIPNEPILLDNSDWTWLSFPRLDREGGNPSPHEVLYGLSGENIDPSNYNDESILQNLPPNHPNIIYSEYLINYWTTTGGIDEIISQRGYKLNLLYDPQPAEKWLFMSGTQLDPGEPITIYGQYDNWVGYWLPEIQSPFDAIPENVLDELLKITAQSWVCIKRNLQDPESDPYWTCAIHEDPVCLDYGEMVILHTIDEGTNLTFQWQRYGNPPMEEERDEPDYFQYNEQASYTPFLIELDTSNNPIEIGAFVDDTCVGATTVLPTDTIILVPGYIDTLSGEVTFQQYYGSLKAEPEIYNEYYVWDNQANIPQQRTIHTNENQDYYLISFKKEQRKNNTEIGLWINCKPNPFSHNCQINYYVPEKCEVFVIIYDLFGHQVNILHDGIIPKGMHSISFDGTDSTSFSLPDGIYIIKLKAGKLHVHRKIIKIN